MKQITTIAFALLTMVLINSCEKDDEKAAPTIEKIILGPENTIKQGQFLHVTAEIKAEAKIDKLSVEIYPETAGPTPDDDFSYYKVHEEYKDLTTLSFFDSIQINTNADVGTYIVKIIVVDANVNSAIETEKFDLTKKDAEFNFITGFVITDDEKKYIGTDLGLFIFDENSNNYSKVETGLQMTALNTLVLTPEANNEELWLGTLEGAYNYTSQLQYLTSNSGLHDNNVLQLSFDLDNRMFLGTPAGVSIKDGGNWILNEGKETELEEVELYSIYDITGMGTATNNYTYVATNGGGVERFKYDIDGITGATIFTTDWTWLESNYINCVYVYDTIQVYGTPAGAAIHYSHLTKWDWETFDTSKGLIDNNVISIVRDANDVLWFGTTSGLSSMDNDTWTSYTQEANGILSNNIKFLAAGNDGSVWFANDLGLCRFLNNQWTNFPK